MIIYNLLFVLKRQKKKIKSSFVVFIILKFSNQWRCEVNLQYLRTEHNSKLKISKSLLVTAVMFFLYCVKHNLLIFVGFKM